MTMTTLRPLAGRISLFWRTFLSLVLLLAVCLLAWVQTFRSLEFEPQALQSARQVASLVNLTRVALQHTDPIARVSLLKTLADEERMSIGPREPGDSFSGYGTNPFTRQVAEALTDRLGPGTIVAREVNGEEGLWVAFSMDKDTYWMLLDPRRVTSIHGSTWVIWLAIAAALSLAGAAIIAELINRPLRRLSKATHKIREGDFTGSQLDEQVPTAEIRDVNIGFNRMASQLAQIERDRALMLAGISHDLRTPLARLRLEAELSVPDQDALQHMGNDIAQVEAIIAKFMDYARPGTHVTGSVELGDLLDRLMQPPAYPTRVQLTLAPFSKPLWVQADEVDLHRVLQNILENAGRYGHTPGSAMAHVHITVKLQHPWVLVGICDAGPGVDSQTLPRLTQPFFRADAARSQASGAGLGLAVVEKMLARMGGNLTLASPCPAEWQPARQPAFDPTHQLATQPTTHADTRAGTGPNAETNTGGPGLLSLIRLLHLPAPGNPRA